MLKNDRKATLQALHTAAVVKAVSQEECGASWSASAYKQL